MHSQLNETMIPEVGLSLDEASVSGALDQLSDLQREFVRQFVLTGGKARRAALLAGHPPKGAHVAAHRHLCNRKVLLAIEKAAQSSIKAALPVAIRTLLHICMHSKDDKARVMAANSLLDRGGMSAPKGGVQVNVGVQVNGGEVQALIGEVWKQREARMSDTLPTVSDKSTVSLAAPDQAAPAGWGGGSSSGSHAGDFAHTSLPTRTAPPQLWPPVDVPPEYREQLSNGEDARVREMFDAQPEEIADVQEILGPQAEAGARAVGPFSAGAATGGGDAVDGSAGGHEPAAGDAGRGTAAGRGAAQGSTVDAGGAGPNDASVAGRAGAGASTDAARAAAGGEARGAGALHARGGSGDGVAGRGIAAGGDADRGGEGRGGGENSSSDGGPEPAGPGAGDAAERQVGRAGGSGADATGSGPTDRPNAAGSAAAAWRRASRSPRLGDAVGGDDAAS